MPTAPAARRGPPRRRYIGALFNGLKHGRGICWYYDDHGQSAGKYAGEFAHGRRDGGGTFEYTDGSVYIGRFSQGRYGGRGRGLPYYIAVMLL